MSDEVRTSSFPWLLVVVAVAVIGLLGVGAVLLVGGNDDGGVTKEVTIPAGYDAATDPPLLPSELRLGVGDTLVIMNHDDGTHEVGPFVVRPGETLRQQFNERGRYQGVCTVHPDGQITIIVT